MIKAIKFVTIPVRDQDASLRFFTEKLGFRVHTDQPYNDAQRWIERGVQRHRRQSIRDVGRVRLGAMRVLCSLSRP